MSCGGDYCRENYLLNARRGTTHIFSGAQLIEYPGAPITLGNRYLRNIKLSKIRTIQ